MTDPSLVLYGDYLWDSPYVFTCCVALEEKQLNFELREINLDNHDQHDPEYQRRSVTGRVPCLEHGDFSLSESSAILEYLEDVFPAPKYPRLLPADVCERARARQVLAWLRSDLLALREERPTTTIFFAPSTEPLSERAREAAGKLIRVADALIPRGGTQLFSTWSCADADLALMLYRLLANGDAVPSRLAAFAQAQWQRPSVHKFVTHPRPRRA